MLSTIHDPRSEVKKEKRRSRLTSTNRHKANLVFGNKLRKVVDIPSIVDDYDNNMNGVGLLRQSYTVQMPTTRIGFHFSFGFWIQQLSVHIS